MKAKEVTQRKVIAMTTAADYEERFNSAMEKLASYRPTTKDIVSEGALLTIIEWVEDRRFPENIRDEYHMRDTYFFCGDCPYFIESSQGTKYKLCDRIGGKVQAGNQACLWLYQRVAEGEITIDGLPKDY